MDKRFELGRHHHVDQGQPMDQLSYGGKEVSQPVENQGRGHMRGPVKDMSLQQSIIPSGLGAANYQAQADQENTLGQEISHASQQDNRDQAGKNPDGQNHCTGLNRQRLPGLGSDISAACQEQP